MAPLCATDQTSHSPGPRRKALHLPSAVQARHTMASLAGHCLDILDGHFLAVAHLTSATRHAAFSRESHKALKVLTSPSTRLISD